MKVTTLLQKFTLPLAFGGMLLSPAVANADVLLTEDFEYAVGNLCGNSTWFYLGSQRQAPIQVKGESLTYPGYQDTAIGRSVEISHLDNQDEDLAVKFSQSVGEAGSAVYASFLANITEVNDAVYSVTLGGIPKSGLEEGKTLSWDGPRVFCVPGEKEGTYKVGFSKYSGTPAYYSSEIKLGETALVVMSLEIVDGNTNDVAKVWVNPTITSNAPAADFTVETGADPSLKYGGLGALQLRQGSTASKTGPVFTIDAIRVATSWGELFASEAEDTNPKLDVQTETLIDASQYQVIGQKVEFGKLKVTYANLQKPASLWVGGKHRSMFTLDKEEVPAGSGSLDVMVYYTPTTTGTHSATVNVDATPTELSQTIGLGARAYDPENMPSFTVDASALQEFETEVNGSVTQKITYATSKLLDYGTIKVAGKSNGAFRVSSTSMLKDLASGEVVITFNPKTAGTFTEDITFAADLATPVTITVKGHTTGGSAPTEDAEGDEFTAAAFDTSNAQKLVIEDFQNCGASNKPLHIDGWTNAAVTGTRAWWAYKELDSDNMTAKVTGYDSKAEDSSEASMLLISPALDFVNAAQPLLAFRIKGRLLSEGQLDNLQVIYIDPTTEEQMALDAKPVTYASPLDNVWAEAIEGLNIPATKDYNDEWMDYVIDFKGQELADKFFIAFGYSTLRGTETSVQYFVDDFSWGRDDIKFIRPSVQYFDMETVIGQENKSTTISVEGLNLTSPIDLKVTGANASKFRVEPAQLPAAGGEFSIIFSSEEKGVHSAYVELSSEGAPLSLISVEANNSEVSAIDMIGADDEVVDVYNLQGIKVRSKVKESNAVESLPAGIYIVGDKKVRVK